MTKLNSEVPISLFPGYFWEYYDGAYCAFSDKICKNGLWVGKHTYDTCVVSGDWYYGHYCKDYRCVPEVEIGNYCSVQEACGRGAFCLRSNAEVNYGYWVEFNSIEDNSSTQVLAYKDGKYLYQENVEKVCKSGWINPNTGKWGEAVKSTNRGLSCSSDSDCPSSDPSIFAPCKCSFDGTKRCDILGGDDVWVNALEKFKGYVEETKNFHTAEGKG